MTFRENNSKGAASPTRLRLTLLTIACLSTAPVCLPAHADVGLAGSVGIAKRYRPNGWIPVTVYVQKSDSDVLHGQVQAFADPDPINHTKQNQPDLGPPPAVYSTTATLAGPAGATGSFRLYVRNIDPVEDNLTLQYRAGDARGDGAVLAKLPMNGTKGANIAGLPISGSDPWALSISSDPAAFNFLNGRKLGLVHTHSGARVSTTVPAVRSPYNNNQNNGILQMPLVAPSLQVTSAGLGDLPDRAAGYAGVDTIIIRSDAPLDGLTDEQAEALRDWVASGGHLLVTSGGAPAGFSSPVIRDLLPAAVNPVTRNVPFPYAGGSSIGEVSAVTLTPKPLTGVRVLNPGPAPLVVTGTYGVGRVTVAAFDPSSTAFGAWTGVKAAAFWRTLLTADDGQPTSILGYVAGREEADASYGGYGSDNQLAAALMRAPSFDAPPVAAIALYLVIYIVVLVPLNYLVLKRMDRREWAWVTVPALVCLFAGGTYAVGYATKGGRLFVNRVSIAETTAGSSVAGVYSAFGIFSPNRHSYEVGIDDPAALLCQPNTFRSYYGAQNDVSDLGDGPPARFYQGASTPRVQDAAVNMWAMRTFDVTAVKDIGGAINCKLTNSGGRLTGTLVNGSAYRLTGCTVCVGSMSQTLATVPAGARVPVDIPAPVRLPENTNLGVNQFYQFPQSAFNDVDMSDWSGDDISSRMRSGTIQFVKGLASEETDYWWGHSGISSEPRVRYTPRPDEAILAGWAEGTGPIEPTVTVDGGKVVENGLTLVIVHIPLSGAKK